MWYDYVINMSGTLIVFEGADGSGKRTQVALLTDELKKRSIAYEVMDFPRYNDSFFGDLAGKLLSGKLGAFEDIPAELAALPFACDRWLLKDQLIGWLAAGKLVISNRYTASSAVYQAAKTPKEKQKDFVSWVYKLEQDVIGLPKEDVVIYLTMPVSISQTLVEQKGARPYLEGKTKDEYEARLSVQNDVIALYDNLAATSPHWKRIHCASDGVLREPDAIHKDIVDALTTNGVL